MNSWALKKKIYKQMFFPHVFISCDKYRLLNPVFAETESGSQIGSILHVM
jgi:hypothetical protein